MAEVYRKVRSGPGAGRKIQQAMGLHADVQERLHTEAELGAHRAEIALAQHRTTGDARIVIEHGKVDWYVILDDERGLKAAMSIEYGRRADEDGSGGMPGLFILHDAMGIPRPGGLDE